MARTQISRTDLARYLLSPSLFVMVILMVAEHSPAGQASSRRQWATVRSPNSSTSYVWSRRAQMPGFAAKQKRRC